MKKGIMALLSVLALAFAFVGCSESDGAYGSTEDSNVVVEALDTTDVDSAATTFTNEFGIDSSLGVPPALPSN